MDIEYVDILAGENVSSIQFANMTLYIGQFVHLLEGDGMG